MSLSISRRAGRLGIALILLQVAGTAFGGVDDQVDGVVRALSDHLKGLDSFRAQSSMEWKFETRRDPHAESTKYNIVFSRPDRLALRQKSGETGATIVSDGEKLFVHLPFREAYVLDEGSSAKRLFDAMAMASSATNMPGIDILSHLMREDPYSAIMNGVVGGAYLGTESAGGQSSDHIRLDYQDGHPAELWVSRGKKPMLMRYSVEMEKSEPRMGDEFYGGRVRKFSVNVSFKKWKTTGKTKDRLFKIKEPKSGRPVDDLVALASARPPHPLLGKRAPKLNLDLLDGGRLSLKDHKEKDVVVLDFWATWCGPCRAAFPMLIEVTGEFEDRGVSFYAINLREESGDVQAYLKQTGFDLTVAMDPEGRTGETYHALGIPQTVIIGRDGTVQAVHQGFSPAMKEELHQELTTLLAGERLTQK